MSENIQTPEILTENKPSFMSKINRKTIIDALVILTPILLIGLYFYAMRTPREIKVTFKDNEKIQNKIDSIQADNRFISERIYDLEKNQTLFFDAINKNNQLIQENNNQLKKLKKAYNDKINSIGTYNVSQLDSFFTSRYRDFYNR